MAKVDACPSQSRSKTHQEFKTSGPPPARDEMEGHHSDITEQTLAWMDIPPQASEPASLNLCFRHRLVFPDANGAPGREMAKWSGLDVAMTICVVRKRASSAVPMFVMMVWGSAENISGEPKQRFFGNVLSYVASFYYYADQGQSSGRLYAA